MEGTIKTYLPEKKYGFIKGDDGKDYFFHESEFRDKSHIANLCEEALVSFEQRATAKGYKAKNCALIDSSDVNTFVIPDKFITSRSNSIRGWDIIEYGHWIVHGRSRDSPDAAKRDVIDTAICVGANGLINLEYYKTTGSDGNYNYSIHNFRGRIVTLGKRNSKGDYSINDLLGLNDRAESLKIKLTELAYLSRKQARGRKIKVWSVIVILSFVALATIPVLIIVLLIAGLVLGCSTDTDYDSSWLERA
jgi:cold shock CspA family protein